MRGAFLFAFALVAPVACSFPGVTYAPGDAGAFGEDVGPAEDGSSGSGQDWSGGDETGLQDASWDTSAFDSAPDVSSSDAPAPPYDASSCDEDGDGFLAEGSVCKGTDCCDTDPSANPAQTTFFTSPDKCGSFDYNCSGSVEYEYGTNLACSGSSLNCTGGSGFTGAPACGSLAPFCTCSPSGLGCAATCGMSTQQGCH